MVDCSAMRFPLYLSVIAAAAMMTTACSKKPAADAKPQADAPAPAAPSLDAKQVRAMFQSPPARYDTTDKPSDALISLGRTLFYDARLSKNHDISCNSCHKLDNYGVDGAPTSTGHRQQLGGRNSPTVYHAAGHLAQFWDGRAADVEAQAKGPILNPVEMAAPSEEYVLTVLKSIPGYGDQFKSAFTGQEDPITYDNLAIAIGAFERGLTTPAPFDKYLAGDDAALSDDAKAGLALFMQTGCTACHNGPLLGGQMYQKFGLVKPAPDLTDAGRFEVTKADADKFVFKVPSLRNVAKTGPYFHDGKTTDLSAAVKTMASLQLGRDLNDKDTGLIVKFLESLTGDLPTDYIAMPQLPESGPNTPKPDPS